METIIVTVTDEYGMFSYDVEIPLSAMVNRLCLNIHELLKQVYPEISPYIVCKGIVNKRTGDLLPPDRRVEECGVWNGDILILAGGK